MTAQPAVDLGGYVSSAAARGELVVQPRMGMSDPDGMADGLRVVAGAPATTVGTITLDSYTRVGDHAGARRALEGGSPLNGFPLVAHGPEVTARVVAAAAGRVPVQVRHGSAAPEDIFATMVRAGLSASEGGPVSYCLPYGQVPLAESVRNWTEATETLARESRRYGMRAHLETFGGCLLGQLCPPSLLIAVSVLEAMFFARHGVESVSLSYAQQTHLAQDVEALAALRALASRLLPAEVDRHITVYTYMGVYPSTARGARRLLHASAELAVRGGAERLIVKTAMEARRIPTVAENVDALATAAARARMARTVSVVPWAADVDYSDVLAEATALIEAVLGLSDDLGTALRRAFQEGLLDVPFCLHRDNAGLARAAIADDGRLTWAGTGRLPLPQRTRSHGERITSRRLLSMLRHTANRHDAPALPGTSTAHPLPHLSHLPAQSAGHAARHAAGGHGARHLTGSPAGHPAGHPSGYPIGHPVGRQRGGRPPYRVAIVGTGPRGIAVLERLGARLAAEPPDRPVEIFAIDAVEVGCGRIWRTDQPEWFLMNTPAGEVTMFSGPSDGGPARAGAGPSLGEWWCATDPVNGDLNGYAPRATYGRYLRYVFETVAAGLPAGTVPHRVRGRVEELTETASGVLRLRTGEGRTITADLAVLTTGHPRPDLDPDQRTLADAAAGGRRARYLRGDSAADMPLDDLPAGSVVGILGLGLSFYDVMAALTTGRGGEFVPAGDGLRYRPSGAEPLLVAGSRSGVPLPARGRNQKHADYRYRPCLFTAERMRRARRAGPLDFRRDVLPWLRAEVDLTYYGTAVHRRYGGSVRALFVSRVLAEVNAELNADVNADVRGAVGAADRFDPVAVVRRQAIRCGVGDLPVMDLEARARPFAGRRFSGPDAFHEAVVEHIRQDLADAELGNVDGPVKAALDTLRDVRSVVRTAVDHGGLTGDSFRDDFLGGFVPVASTLSAGPPRIRLQQVLALLDAGVLRLLGPGSEFHGDPRTGALTADSSQVDGASVELDALIDARIPAPDLGRDPAPLTRRLTRAGLLTAFTNTSGPRPVATGGVHVTEAPFHPVRADGEPHPALYVLGIPTEHTRWFTQVGSGRPGGWGEFTADADAIAADLLAPLYARTSRGTVPACATEADR